MIARMEYQNLSEDVGEKNGVAFYIFFWDHINRSIGTMDHYSDWVSNAPYYTFENDKLVRKKKFKDGRYVLSKLYELIYQSSIINFFKLGFPLKLNEYHYDLVSEIILKSKNTYKKQFGNDNFYLVFYPSFIDYTDEEIGQFKLFLETKDIDYIDLNDFIKYELEHTLHDDPHPNANTNQMIAKEILNRMNL